jgi:hypothetical protein
MNFIQLASFVEQFVLFNIQYTCMYIVQYTLLILYGICGIYKVGDEVETEQVEGFKTP